MANQPTGGVKPEAAVGPPPAEVHGQVLTDRGTAAAGLPVELWDVQLQGANLLNASTTAPDGRYLIAYDRAKLVGKQLADIEVRVLQRTAVVTGAPIDTEPTTERPPTDRGASVEDAPAVRELARSKVIYQAPVSTEVNLVVAFAAVRRPTEHARLVAAMQPLMGQVPATGVGPTSVTFLANRAGYDPRAIAMSLQSSRASAQTKIPADHYYALFRTGAAADVTTAHQLTDGRLVSAIRVAERAGIIGTDHPIDATLAIHRTQARQAFRTYVPPGGMSTLNDLLSLRLKDPEKDTFIDALRASDDNPQTLWDGLARAGMSKDTIAQLQTDGKLGALTLQNAPLMQRLIQQRKVVATGDLARAGLYQADAWRELIGTDVPAGLTVDQYATGLAAQVRLAHPTLVAADRLRKEQPALGGARNGNIASAVASFLEAGAATKEVGTRPLNTWDGFASLPADIQQGALHFERVYQISPSDQSLDALLGAGLDSAFSVARLTEQEFLDAHGASFPSVREAQLVHRKAQHVHGTALSLATDYLRSRSGPHLISLHGPDGPTLPEGTPAKATLETLFGNLDFCSCEECNSVLGAASYLVDLLEMLDLSNVPHDLENPQKILFDRRPDLQHILLSCENTNTAMAYIDIVNEVLEYYVVNGSLTGFMGHDTSPDATTADLLADPPFVEASAYTPLADAVFPVPLPFHLPLDALRLYYTAWDTTLTDALAIFGSRADGRRERLGLNPAEQSILTDHTFKTLAEHFGEPAGESIAAINTAIANAEVFCRRLSLAYVDLAAILQTRFVNPGVVLVPLLEALHVDLGTIQSWFTGGLTDQQLTAQLPADLDPAPYGGNVLAWLTTNRALLMGMIVLTPTAGADPDLDCDFGVLELRLSLPDATANALTESEYTKLYRFIRVWHRLGGAVSDTDEMLTLFLPALPPQPTPAELDAAFVVALARIANFRGLLTDMNVPASRQADWLALQDTTISADARRDQLAHLLRLGAVDFASLAALTGIDPLAADMDADDPSLLRFVDAWRAVKSSPLKVADLDFLARHLDPGGGHTVTPVALHGDLRLLRDAQSSVDAMFGAGASTDLAATQAAMALVYDPKVVGDFFGLLGGSTTYDVAFNTVEEALPAPLATAAPGLGIDPFRKRLTYQGVLSPATLAALETTADGLTLSDVEEITTAPDLAAYVADFKTAAAALRSTALDDLNSFTAAYPELATVLDTAIGIADPTAQAATVRAGVLPQLATRLKAVAQRAVLTSVLRADDTVVAALTSDPVVLHAANDPSKVVLDDLAALEQTADLDHDQVLDVVLDPSVTDDHILYVQAPAGTLVELQVDGVVVIPSGPVGANGEVSTAAALPLTVGTPVSLELTVTSLPAQTTAALLWRTKGIAKTPIPSDRLLLANVAATASASLVRLRKAATVANALGLTPAEVTFFAASCPDTKGVLNDLPVDTSIAPADAVALAARLMALVSFAAFRSDTESEADTWVGVLSSGGLGTANGQALAAATASWPAADVADAVTFLAVPPANLSALDTLVRLRRLLDLAVLTNQSIANLRDWTKADPAATDINALKAALKAGLDTAAYRDTIQSVNDALRNARRDALVAWILTFAPPKADIETPDELYEYFLVDVEMDACMQTSRIRLALSTVQLFVTRCLMGLEISVAPSSIRADHWAWMKRYRVWEANRKIFLYPENWLEPELRDGKSAFFSELEADLLKADITDELAENAYLAYLKKLDDVARLEIVGMYLQQGVPNKPDDDVFHVFARSNGRTRQYWYRRFEYGYWTPWEKIGLNIEGDSVIPAMWRNQLFLFWLTILVKPRSGQQDQSIDPMAQQHWQPRAPVDVEITFNWGEYYNGSWVSPKSTNMGKPVVVRGLQEFHPEDIVLASRTEQPPNVSERLIFSLIYYHQSDVKAWKVVFTSKNVGPIMHEDDPDTTLRDGVEIFNRALFWDRQTEATLESTSLDVPRTDLTLRVAQPPHALSATVDETILTKQLPDPGFNVRTAMHPVENQFEAPFFYADEHSTFLLQPDETLRSFVQIVDYVPVATDPIKINVPILVEQLAGPNPRDPIWNPPWTNLVNLNLKNVIGNTDPFELDGVQFNALGLMR
jgi:hypothetical protein